MVEVVVEDCDAWIRRASGGGSATFIGGGDSGHLEWQCLTFALFDGSDLQSSWHKIVLFDLELCILLISFCQVRSTQVAILKMG